MLPEFESDGNLPPGIHRADWNEFSQRFGGDGHRDRLIGGLRRLLDKLVAAGCQTAYIDGSFVTAKSSPGDYDGAWELENVDLQKLLALEPILFDFSNKRAAQKAKYFGEMFPADSKEGATGRTFLEFFQQDKATGEPKGIVAIDLQTLL